MRRFGKACDAGGGRSGAVVTGRLLSLVLALAAATPLDADEIIYRSILGTSLRFATAGGMLESETGEAESEGEGEGEDVSPVAGEGETRQVLTEKERRQIIERLEDEMAEVLGDLRSASRRLAAFRGRPPRKISVTVDWDEQTARIRYLREEKALAVSSGWLRQLFLGSIDAAIRSERVSENPALALFGVGLGDLLEEDALGLLAVYETKRAYGIGPADADFRLLGGLALREYWKALMMVAVLEVLPAHFEWRVEEANLAAYGCFLALQAQSLRCSETKLRDKTRLPREHLELILAGRLDEAVDVYGEIGLGSLRDEKRRMSIWGGDLGWALDHLSASTLDSGGRVLAPRDAGDSAVLNEKLRGQCDAETWHYLTGIHALHIVSELRDQFWARVFDITVDGASWQIRSSAKDALVCRTIYLPESRRDDYW